MKKLVFALIFIIYIVNIASAISVDIKENYERQETMIVKISGDIKEPVTNDNIELKRGHVSVPMDYDVKKLGNDYYLWAVSPLNGDNYTLWLKGIVTTIGGKINKSDFGYNFSVSGNLTDYYINPGIIFSDKDFEIKAFNNLDVQKEINVGFPEERKIILQQGENKIYFSISNVYGTQLVNFSVGKYDVKAYIIGKNEISNVTNVSKINVYFIPQKIDRELFSGELESLPVTITNEGNDLENVSLEYNKSIFSINPELPSSLENGKSLVFNLSIETEKDVNEDIILNANGFKSYLNVRITILTPPFENASSAKNESRKSLFYCDELGGEICNRNEECSAENVESLDGMCCKGKCIKKEERGGSWIGYIIIAIAIILIIFIYYKYKGIKAEKNPLAKRINSKKIP